jgi:hypothetical protein
LHRFLSTVFQAESRQVIKSSRLQVVRPYRF